jgi:hypothetical protein
MVAFNLGARLLSLRPLQYPDKKQYVRYSCFLTTDLLVQGVSFIAAKVNMLRLQQRTTLRALVLQRCHTMSGYI